ncbi:MAG TPA: sulfatase [Vicinamibacteria bacterium]|nr:sulfatase [Vicinamibacteria bacterium]
MAQPRIVRRAVAALLPVLVAAAAGCRGGAEKPATVRLVDVFDAKSVEGSPPQASGGARRTEWRFDGPPATPSPRPGASPAPFPATRGWEAGPGVAGLAIRDGLLVGRTTADFPILRVERTTGLDDADQVHAVEVRMRASKGTNLSVQTRPAATVDLQAAQAQAVALPWLIKSPIVAGDQVQTYTMTPPAPVSSSRIRQVLIRPTDAAGADFAIESVRLVFRREHLAGVPSGVSWQGLRDVFRETLVTRSPETVRFEVEVPARPVMHVVLGTPEDEPVTFRIAARRGDRDVPLLAHTVTTPYRWEPRVLDLAELAGARVTLSLTASAGKPGTIAFWGAPAIRPRAERRAGEPPQTVILVQLDTLRTDHLDAYGYERKTAPTLARLAEEGALFRHAVTQTGWTKAATPSVHTSLFPTTHGVHQIPDRLPASANTIAEAYRAAGYATASFSSVSFTGQFTNLHQGFEELHESESTVGRAGPQGAKTSREYVDRLVAWLEDHRDVPSFVYLHFFDPHSPYEPNRPYDTMWADPKGRDEYLRQLEVLKKFIKDPFLAQRGMATPDELRAAGIDPAAFIRYSKDWYDGSIRGMDAEIARLVERIEELGLRDRSLVAFFADHGEEFHEHGNMWHGRTVYGEMMRVPLIMWGPGHVPEGLSVEDPVQLVDIMPTLLETSGLSVPKEAQGQSLRPLLAARDAPGTAAANGGWKRRPLVSEKHPFGDTKEFPGASESYAIVEGDWKLIHNVVRAPGKPEFELFDFYKDPHDQRDLAAANPEVVARLGKMLDGWRRLAKQAQLKPDTEAVKGMSAEQLERLRSLGYVR